MHRDNYYPYPSWGYGGVYYGGSPYYPPVPASYPGYHPAYGDHPPSNYQWNQYNKTLFTNQSSLKFFELHSYWGLPSQEYCHAADTFW
jgi:hypothetical protein